MAARCVLPGVRSWDRELGASSLLARHGDHDYICCPAAGHRQPAIRDIGRFSQVICWSLRGGRRRVPKILRHDITAGARPQGGVLIMTDRVILGLHHPHHGGLFLRDHADTFPRNRGPAGPQGISPTARSRAAVCRGHAGHGDLEERKAKEPDVPASELFDPVIIRILLCVVAWTAGYYAIFNPLGYIVATTHLPARPDGVVQPRQVGRQCAHRRRCFAVGSYIMFVKLDVNLPSGVISRCNFISVRDWIPVSWTR